MSRYPRQGDQTFVQADGRTIYEFRGRIKAQGIEFPAAQVANPFDLPPERNIIRSTDPTSSATSKPSVFEIHSTRSVLSGVVNWVWRLQQKLLTATDEARIRLDILDSTGTLAAYLLLQQRTAFREIIAFVRHAGTGKSQFRTIIDQDGKSSFPQVGDYTGGTGALKKVNIYGPWELGPVNVPSGAEVTSDISIAGTNGFPPAGFSVSQPANTRIIAHLEDGSWSGQVSWRAAIAQPNLQSVRFVLNNMGKPNNSMVVVKFALIVWGD